MKRALACALVALAGCGHDKVVTHTVTKTVEAAAPAGPRSFDPQAIYRKESPGVVTLITLDGSGGRNLFGRSSRVIGSGFVVDADGYVATNAHVVTDDNGQNAKDVYVEFGDGNKVRGQVVGTDPNADIALVKISSPKHLVALPFGSTAELRVGDPVAAIGSPFEQEQSLSVGVVSALHRDIQSLTRFTIGNAIQTDAAINHGNSGGPLLDAGGKVIGINSQIESTGGGGEGVGFAIPVETVKRSIEQLREKGRVDYAYLGIKTVTLYPQLAKRLGLSATTGALIDGVVPGGPADDAGLHGARSHIDFQDERGIPVGGDVVVAVDGRKLSQAQDLTDVIGLRRPGDTVALTVVRNGRRRIIRVELAKRPAKLTREG